MESKPGFCEMLTVKINELNSLILSLQSKITHLEHTDRQHYHLIMLLMAVSLGINNPLTKSLVQSHLEPTNSTSTACHVRNENYD